MKIKLLLDSSNMVGISFIKNVEELGSWMSQSSLIHLSCGPHASGHAGGIGINARAYTKKSRALLFHFSSQSNHRIE